MATNIAERAQQFRRVMGKFATGVTVITYMREGDAAGMTANAFLSVSIEPQLILVSARNASRFCASVAAGDTFGVNFLAEHQEDLSAHFGGRAVAGIDVPIGYEAGTPYIRDSLAHIVARVVDIHQAGDHKLFIGQAEHLVENEHANPLLFYRGKYARMASAAVARD